MVASVVVLALVALWWARRVRVRREGSEFLAAPDHCFVAPAPLQRRPISKPGTPLSYEIVTDAEGFRIGSTPPRTARCRLLFVGDSFTEGSFVSGDEAFPSVAESQLVARGYDVRSCNAGMHGHTIVEERVQALGRYAQQSFEVVVIAQTANDLEDLARLIALGCPIEGAPPTTFVPGETSVTITTALDRELRRAAVAHNPPSGDACKSVADRYLAVLRDTVRELRARGSAVILASVEPLFCTAADSAFTASVLMPRVAAAVAEEGGTFVDASPFMNTGADARLLPHDGHPSPKGHRAIGAIVADALAKQSELSRCR
jgi:lysophospholipase L1-like esterase